MTTRMIHTTISGTSTSSIVDLEDAFGTDSRYCHELAHEDLAPYSFPGAREDNPLKTSLNNLQRTGVSFILKREHENRHGTFGGMILDELGCGKTLTVLAGILAAKRHASGLLNDCRDERMRQELAEHVNGRTLVIVPTNVLRQWQQQIEEHVQPDQFKVLAYHGTNRRTQAGLKEFDLVLSTYGTLQREWNTNMGQDERPFHNGSVFNLNWHRIVLDEAHNIRNQRTKTNDAAMALEGNIRWCVTGTPIWNSLEDIQSLFAFLRAYPLGVKDQFYSNVLNYMHYQPFYAFQHLNGFLMPIAIRRGKASLNLPSKTEHVCQVPFSESEQVFYDALYDWSRERVDKLFQTESWLRGTSWGRIMISRINTGIFQVMLRLRQACDHPALVLDALAKQHPELTSAANEGGKVDVHQLMKEAATRLMQNHTNEDDCAVCMSESPSHCAVPCGHSLCEACLMQIRNSNIPFCPFCRQDIREVLPVAQAVAESSMTKEEVVRERKRKRAEETANEPRWPTSSKLQYAMDITRGKLERGEKVIIFSQWTSMLDLIEKELNARSYPFVRIDGKVSMGSRFKKQKTFQEDPSIPIILCSLTSSAEGINLQAGRTVILMDPWWNHARTDQAGNRSHRLGQTGDVEVYHLLMANSIEKAIYQLQQRRRQLSNTVTRGSTEQTHGMTWASSVQFTFDL